MMHAPGSLSGAAKLSQHRAPRPDAAVVRKQPAARMCIRTAASASASSAAGSNHQQLHGASIAAAAAVAAVVLQTAAAGSAAAAGEQQQQQPQQLQQTLVVQQQQELHQQQQQLQLCTQGPQLRAPPLADLAGDFFGASPDLPDPFTLYGTNLKSYSIEQLQGEKVVSRSRGFTVTTCVSGKAASEEGPLFNGLPLGAKVEAGDGLLCKRATGQDLKAVCKESCGSACEAALAAYEARYNADTGLTLDAKERSRILKNCRHGCSYECTKSGRYHDFAAPSRR